MSKKKVAQKKVKKRARVRNLKIVTHYRKDDPEFYGDYDSIEVFNNRGKCIACFGDRYSAGKWGLEGFLFGLDVADGREPVTRWEKVADGY